MRKFIYTVGENNTYKTVESFLMKGQGYSRNIIRKLKTPTGILLNGSFARTVDRVQAGDNLEVCLPQEENTPLFHSNAKVPVIYSDSDIIIYNKPPFMATHPSKLHQQDSLSNVFARDMAAEGQSPPFRAVYRLDRDTDGLVVIAKNHLAAAKLAGRIKKQYTGIVLGSLPQKQGKIDAPIAQLEPHKMRRGVRPDGQRAVTLYEVLQESGKYSLVRFCLETGRTHQIRVHMAYIGHPLAGDSMYGGNDAVNRQALTCTQVAFLHPASGAEMEFCIDMQKDCLNLMNKE